MKNRISEAELKKKKQRYAYLLNDARREVAEALSSARDLGDLSENAEYESAKNRQAEVEAEILELKEFIDNAEVVDVNATPKDEVNIGKKVKVLDLDNNTEIEFVIVDSSSRDIRRNRISDQSPIGKSLIGSKINDIKKIETPKKDYNVKIVAISIDEEYQSGKKEDVEGE